ncbi:tetratricopeptide repeat protein [Sulfitobacter albidus]|uniref:Tetratricopeptide repeat protein n=1 Tax=Sulfitobacter albidus TaxID=2829501 RepID=A0A975PNB7_9RHOB|nr:tetratricopeptide repeat protein [Sulfitobacter albidus]QUJ77301.1 tetratricopeptide repeat protein [Sulfitobacter albidus]
MRLLLATTLALSLPMAALAAGGGEEKAPSKPKCADGLVYDKSTKTCVNANNNTLDVDTLYQTVRSLAHDGQYDAAQVVLAAMPQDDDRTLTYMGFTARKMGQTEAAMTYYSRALARNPGNVLARSYMGQGMVDAGDMKGALAQLRAIRAHGGTGTWAEASLRTAIATGKTFSW